MDESLIDKGSAEVIVGINTYTEGPNGIIVQITMINVQIVWSMAIYKY